MDDFERLKSKDNYSMTLQEIADLEGCSKQNVIDILDRAYKKVRARLNHNGYDKDYFFKD